MKTVFIFCILAMLLSFPLQDKGTFRGLKQLEGGWKMQTDKRSIYEHWSVGSSRVDLQACKLEYSIVSPK